MKLLFFTFAVAIIVQVSVAVPLLRHKRNDLFVNTFQETVTMIKKFLPSSEALLRTSLKEIPNTPAYAKYIKAIEVYLTEMEEFRNTPGNCFEKNLAMIEKFVKLSEEVDPEEETPETLAIDAILERNGGAELLKDIEEFGEKLDNPEVEKALTDITPEDALRIAPLIIEVC